MCGIVGIRRFDGGTVDGDLLRTMTAQLVHRGPDDEGYWLSGSTGFGHRRLSIIDVGGSQQPMASVDGRLQVVFNGEIFNYRDLRAGCPYPYRTDGDTEVLLALHAARGPAAVEALRGQFAYALADAATDELWLFRDRMGVLPLYYYSDDRCFAFASEIKALVPILPGGGEVDGASLDSYLARRAVAGPATLFRGVRKLLPGERLRVAPDGSRRSERYWSVPSVDPEPVSDADAVERVSDALVDAVRAALVADVPVGSLLSGGVDSSLVVAIMAGLRGDAPIETFAAGFGDPRHDELPFARTVSELFGTRHHAVRVGPDDFIDLWRTLTWHRDAPISEPADVAVFKLATEARRSVKVLLSGEGSDELFAGYPKYRLARWGRVADAVPATVRRRAGHAAERALPAGAARPRVALRALAAPTEADRAVSWFAPFSIEERHRLLGSRPAPAAPMRGRDAVARMLAQDCAGWLPDNLLERGDRMSMAASVELRPPLLDHRLVELAFSLPSSVKLRRGQTKWVLKEAARRHLPDAIVDRRKVGFRVPLDTWFRGGLRDMAHDLLLAPRAFTSSALSRPEVEALLATHESGRRDESIRIWTLLSLEVWHDVFIARGR